MDLAVSLESKASETEGDLEHGTYVYDIVWEGTDGQLFGVQVETNTQNFSDFNGSIQINNLPETSVAKKIYRTDKTGDGEKRLIGELRGGAANMLDTVSDRNRGAQALNETPQLVNFARKATVSLNNISEINPPQ